MSLSDTMTTLANTVRATIHHSTDYKQGSVLLGLSDMVYRLNNFILRTNVPVFTNSDSTFVTKLQDGKQVFNSTKPININTGVYPNNYTEDISLVSKSGTRFEQGITIETDGNVNLTDTKILFYLAFDDPHKEIDCQNIVKLRDNVYRLSTNGIATKESLMFEPFNINLDISNCTYIKFSELSFNVIEPSVIGGGS